MLESAATSTNPFDPLYQELMLQRTKVTSDMNFWQVQDDASQFNHSNESGFRRFLSLSSSSEIVCAKYHPVNNPQLQQQALQHLQQPTKLGNTQTISVSEPEDLMLSATTHFSPIKPTYRDGYTFFIDSNYDKIHYERSESGSYYVNNKRVMKYKVRKAQPNREMIFGRDMGFSNNNYNDIDLDAIEMEAKEFTLKFLVNENDKGCQTDTREILMTASSCNRLVDFTEDYCKKKIYDEYFKSVNDTSKWRYYGNICGGLQVNSNTNNNNNNNTTINTNNDNCSYFSVNRNKSGNTDNELYATGGNKTFSDILMSSNSSSSSICTITSHDTLAIDPFESWRRVDTNTCDALNYNSSSNNNNNSNSCQHSLWEQCSLCTRNDHHDPYYGEKSIPANRLLKDELQLDGEEIMTVIQNLYITSDYCDDGEDDKEDAYNNFGTTYTDLMMMLDDSMEGGVHENKFYEQHHNQSMYGKGVILSPTTNVFAAPQSDEMLQLEKFDEITLAKMQWPEMYGASGIKDTDHQAEKYLELFKLFQESMVKEPDDPNNNNNSSYYQQDEENRPKVGRKRRHSTCPSLMEKKSHRYSQYDHHEPLYSFQPDHANDAGALIEENANFFLDAAKMLKFDLEKIILCNDNDNNQEIEDYDKEVNGTNYYRNILQQQQALLKQMDLGRPLTR